MLALPEKAKTGEKIIIFRIITWVVTRNIYYDIEKNKFLIIP